jgi:3-phosphoshikimate 1-carboxyvinyltransferase
MTSCQILFRGAVQCRRSGPVVGALTAPSDKSISHRALILGGLAKGRTRISGLLESDDVLNTAKVIAALGAGVRRDDDGVWIVEGCNGRFATPEDALDFGNAGTGVRLMMGAVAGAGASAVFTGDASLSSRPMGRVTAPLGAMGAVIETRGERLPVSLSAAPLTGVHYQPPIASAQVKSALLLAGLGANGRTSVHETHATRDHTETMLRAFGAQISVEEEPSGGVTIAVDGPQQLTAHDVEVPGDPSSAAFAVIAALITPGSCVEIRRVMDNPARTGVFMTLQEMGADLEIVPGPVMAGEKTMNLTARGSQLRGVDVPADRAPSMIDEYPILAVAAACASGTTRMAGLAELRAKESDRLAGTAALLSVNGVSCEIQGDTLCVTGQPGETIAGGGHVATHHDHRLAMSALILGLVTRSPVAIDDASMIATSYPEFFDQMTALGAVLEAV